MKKRIARLLLRLIHRLDPPVEELHVPEETIEPAGVVEADSHPVWSPSQEGGVIIAEPKIISLERQRIGEDKLQEMYDEASD